MPMEENPPLKTGSTYTQTLFQKTWRKRKERKPDDVAHLG